MPKFIADFHIHSRYSRACSKNLSIPELSKWAKIKGVGLLGTGDFTHPLWMNELKDMLRETSSGFYEHAGSMFILSAEVSTLYYKADKAHQIHHILLAPSIASVERINKALGAFGSLTSDGRPWLRMEAKQLVEIVLGLESRAMVIPAHIWTPHFSVFGSRSGFDTIEECFEEQTPNIFALETGLSSDPAMNGRLKALDRYAMISNSDTHSARRMGREANIFDCPLTYDAVMKALKTNDRKAFVSTIEFFPEEGKYHYDGHRNCKVSWAPAETKQHGGLCSVCGRKVTVGVMHRVDALADRTEELALLNARPFQRLVPLDEIISEVLDVGVGTQTVEREYQKLISQCGTEFNVLLDRDEESLRAVTTPRIAEAICRVRTGNIAVEPGYDGEYGKVHIFGETTAAIG